MKFMKWKIFLAVAVICMALSGCSAQIGIESQTPTPDNQNLQNSTDSPQISNYKHSESAFEAYPRAKEDALRLNEDAVLYQIPPTRQMEGNFGLNLGGPAGWFFMFKTPDSPVELYVEIVEGKVYGRTEAQPIVVGERKFIFNPLDMESKLLDNEDALQIYINDGGAVFLAQNPDIELDFGLLYLNGTENPVWNIYSTSDLGTPLYSVDAVTGKKVVDPYQQIK